jgi:hypothetical protein
MKRIAAILSLVLALVFTGCGSTGHIGPQGNQGAAGSSFVSDSGIPSEETGNVGDTYLDLSTGNVYVKNVLGLWELVSNLTNYLDVNSLPATFSGNSSVESLNLPNAEVGDAYTQVTTGKTWILTSAGWVLTTLI